MCLEVGGPTRSTAPLGGLARGWRVLVGIEGGERRARFALAATVCDDHPGFVPPGLRRVDPQLAPVPHRFAVQLPLEGLALDALARAAHRVGPQAHRRGGFDERASAGYITATLGARAAISAASEVRPAVSKPSCASTRNCTLPLGSASTGISALPSVMPTAQPFHERPPSLLNCTEQLTAPSAPAPSSLPARAPPRAPGFTAISPSLTARPAALRSHATVSGRFNR